MILGVGKYVKEYMTGAFTDNVNTGISVNAGVYGQTILVISSDHGNDGDITISDISMLRLGYSDNHVHVTPIVQERGTSTPISLSASYNNESQLLISGFRRYLLISNKPLY